MVVYMYLHYVHKGLCASVTVVIHTTRYISVDIYYVSKHQFNATVLSEFTYSNDRGSLKVGGKQLYVDSGGHEHQFQAPPPLNESSQYTQQEVTMDVSLMHLGKCVSVR